MEYLKKSFSVYVSNPPREKPPWRGYPGLERPREEPRVGHPYVDAGGMCLTCALDEIGHNAKWSLNHLKEETKLDALVKQINDRSKE